MTLIFNLVKHLIMALLLDAGALLAFDIEVASPAPATAAAPQSCIVPLATANGATSASPTQPDTGARS